MKDRNAPRDTKLKLFALEEDLHMRSPFKSDRRSFDETSRNAEVQNATPNQHPAVRQKDLRTALTPIARMTALLVDS